MGSGIANIFAQRPFIIGMIHCQGKGLRDSVDRALAEIDLLDNLGVDGAIIENYHGASVEIVRTALRESRPRNLALGVNILPNEVAEAYHIVNTDGARFIQLDFVAGTYIREIGYPYHGISVDERMLRQHRERYPDVVVLGGVWPKYYAPVPESNLAHDLALGATRADGIVVTGFATGKAPSLAKLQKYRARLDLTEAGRGTPIIQGSGTEPAHYEARAEVFAGAIVGTDLKRGGDVSASIDPERVALHIEARDRARRLYLPAL